MAVYQTRGVRLGLAALFAIRSRVTVPLLPDYVCSDLRSLPGCCFRLPGMPGSGKSQGIIVKYVGVEDGRGLDELKIVSPYAQNIGTRRP